MDESEEEYEHKPELIGEVADDALRIFRLNIFIIAVYSSIVGLLYQQNPDGVGDIFNSLYTLFGILFWMGGTTASILTYRAAREYSTALARPNPEGVFDKYAPKTVVRNITADAFGVLLSVLALFFGFLDGLSNGDMPLWVPSLIVILALGFVSSVLGFYIMMEKTPKAYRSAIGWLKEKSSYARSAAAEKRGELLTDRTKKVEEREQT